MPATEFSMLRQTFQLMTRPRQIICDDEENYVATQHLESAMKDKKILSR